MYTAPRALLRFDAEGVAERTQQFGAGQAVSEIVIAHADLDVQMRSGFRPAVSDVSDDRALFDDRAHREELHALEVRVTGHDAMTVIDPHLASAELVEHLDRGVSEA